MGKKYGKYDDDYDDAMNLYDYYREYISCMDGDFNDFSKWGCLTQNLHTITIPKLALIIISQDPNISKTDYRVLMVLLTKLNGYKRGKRGNASKVNTFTAVSVKMIAETLNISAKKVKESIENLIMFGIIEQGSDEVTKNGYRFTF